MKALRLALALAATLLIVGGYAASQFAYFNGSTADYTARIEASPGISAVAMVILLASVCVSLCRKGAE